VQLTWSSRNTSGYNFQLIIPIFRLFCTPT
jgi:hypothetical protein